MARQYSPNEVRYLIENHLLPAHVLGRELKRSKGGVKQMLKRLKEDGRIEVPKPKTKTKIFYEWIPTK